MFSVRKMLENNSHFIMKEKIKKANMVCTQVKITRTLKISKQNCSE